MGPIRWGRTPTVMLAALMLFGCKADATKKEQRKRRNPKPPVARADQASTAEDTPVVIDVLANDRDQNEDTLSLLNIAAPPMHGAARPNPDGTVTYEPAPNFSGTDEFRYTVTDGTGNSIGRVTVTVSGQDDAPLPLDDLVATAPGQAVTIDVLANDSDPEGATLQLTGVSQPLSGSAAITGTEVEYVPNPGFVGSDSFSYTVTDGTLTASATVTVTIARPTNDLPVAADDEAVCAVDLTIELPVLANDTDGDGDPLALSQIVTPPGMGTASIGGNGTTIIYQPDPGATGSVSLSYRVIDGFGGSADGAVTIQVEDRFLVGAADGSGSSQLFAVNPLDGSETLLGDLTGFTGVRALVTGTAGQLYATGFNPGGDHVLLTVTLSPLGATEVGPTGIDQLGTGYAEVLDLAVRPSDGAIFAWLMDGGGTAPALATVEPATGQATLVAPLTTTNAAGIAFAGDGILYQVDEMDLHGLDAASGASVWLDTITLPFGPARFEGLAILPGTRTVSGLLFDPSGGAPHLVALDLDTGVATSLGQTAAGLVALAWAPLVATGSGGGTGGGSGAKVAITEFINNPNGTDAGREWVELFNFGQSTVDLGGFTLEDEDSDSTQLPVVSIASGDFLIITKDKATFEADWLNGQPDPRVIEVSSLTLANGGDELLLKDATGALAWSVAWDDDDESGRATFLAVDDFNVREFGSKADPGVTRGGDDNASPGFAGYEGAAVSPADPHATTSANGDSGSPLAGAYTVR